MSAVSSAGSSASHAGDAFLAEDGTSLDAAGTSSSNETFSSLSGSEPADAEGAPAWSSLKDKFGPPENVAARRYAHGADSSPAASGGPGPASSSARASESAPVEAVRPFTRDDARASLSHASGQGMPITEKVQPDGSRLKLYADGYEVRGPNGEPGRFVSADMSALGAQLTSGEYQRVSDRAVALAWDYDSAGAWHDTKATVDGWLGVAPKPIRSPAQEAELKSLQEISRTHVDAVLHPEKYNLTLMRLDAAAGGPIGAAAVMLTRHSDPETQRHAARLGQSLDGIAFSFGSAGAAKGDLSALRYQGVQGTSRATLTVPQGLSVRQFEQFSASLRGVMKAEGLPPGETYVQGSRAGGRARPGGSDIDVLHVVSEAHFNAFVAKRLAETSGKPQRQIEENARTDQIIHARGISRTFESSVWENAYPALPGADFTKVQFSIVRQGSPFINGPLIPLAEVAPK